MEKRLSTLVICVSSVGILLGVRCPRWSEEPEIRIMFLEVRYLDPLDFDLERKETIIKVSINASVRQ